MHNIILCIVLLLAFSANNNNAVAAKNDEYSFLTSVSDKSDPTYMRIAHTTTSVTANGIVEDRSTKFITSGGIGSEWKPNLSPDGKTIVFFNSPNDVEWQESNNTISVVDMDII
mgnify:CR=1 FL=1